MAKANLYCDHCANTGIVWAALYGDAETKERQIAVEVCEEHSSSKLAEKAVEGMKATGLPIMIVGPGNKPNSAYDVERPSQEV